MENKEYYREETMLKELLTRQKSDEAIGMPDVEEELRKFHAQHGRKTAPVVEMKPKATSLWRRAAAVIAALVVIGGISWAAVYYSSLSSSEPVTVIEQEATRIDEPAAELPIVAPAPAEGALVYDKAELGYILSQLTQRYGLEEPDYQQASLAHIRLHVTLPETDDVHELLEVLNHFGKFHLEVRDNRIYVLSINK